jgi:hypothetical protein
MSLQQITSADISSLPSGSVSNTQFATGAVESYMSAQGSSFGFRNRIINGAMVIDQRNAGGSVTPASGAYTVDRWTYGASQASKCTVQQNAGNLSTPPGYTNYLGIVVGTAVSSIGATDYFQIAQKIEAYNMADFGWGTSSGSPVTLSFWVRCNVTGTYSGSVQSTVSPYASYPFTFTVNNSATWQYVTINIPAPANGTLWATGNAAGIYLQFNLACGSTYSGTANTWTNSNVFGATGAASLMGTIGNYLHITGVQLERSSTASAFEYRDYTRELQMCQRYAYYMQLPINTNSVIPCTVYPNPLLLLVPIYVPVTMRATPSSTLVTQPTTGFTFNSYNGTASSNQVPSISVNVRSGTPYLTEWVLTGGSNWGTASYTGMLTSTGSGSGSCILSAEL